MLADEPLSPVAPLGMTKSSVSVFVWVFNVPVTLAFVPALPVDVVPTTTVVPSSPLAPVAPVSPLSPLSPFSP